MENHKPAKFTENLGNTPITHWLYPLTVVIATSVSFLPVLSNGFVEWDDLESLIENPYYRGLGWDQVRWMFTTFLMGPYQPLSWLTFGLDYWLWGMNPVGYHLTNLIIHTANAVFFYFISRQLLSMALSKPSSQADWRLNLSAVVSALVFAIHPLRVESVAWATERTFRFLLSLDPRRLLARTVDPAGERTGTAMDVCRACSLSPVLAFEGHGDHTSPGSSPVR